MMFITIIRLNIVTDQLLTATTMPSVFHVSRNLLSNNSPISSPPFVQFYPEIQPV